MNSKERLKKIRAALGCTQQEMADKLNIPLRAYRTYEYDSKGYPESFIQNLIELFSVNANYFFTGIGRMFINTDENTYESQNDTSIDSKVSKFNVRLSELQKKTGLSDKDFAYTLNLDEDELLEYKSADRKPNLKIILAVKRHYKISLDRLILGD